jgi:hypothetical protein
MDTNIIRQNNLDYSLKISLNGSVVLEVSQEEVIKYDIDVDIMQSNVFKEDNFKLEIYNLERSLADRLEKPRLDRSKIIGVQLWLKGTGNTGYYKVLDKQALEVYTQKKDNATTTVTTMYGTSSMSLGSIASSINFKDKSLKDVVIEIANKTGNSIEEVISSDNPLNATKSSINLNKSPTEILEMVQASANKKNTNIFMDNSSVVIQEDGRIRGGTSVITDNDMKGEYPRIQSTQIKTTLYLNPQLRVGNGVQFEYQNNPILKNRTYQITGVNHSYTRELNKGSSGSTVIEALYLPF